MVDVSDKATTTREAIAEGRLTMEAETLAVALSGGGAKGDVRSVAEIAGVMAAKRTADLIPMCHPLMLSSVKVSVEPLEDRAGLGVVALLTVSVIGTAVGVVGFGTLYDQTLSYDLPLAFAAVVLGVALYGYLRIPAPTATPAP